MKFSDLPEQKKQQLLKKIQEKKDLTDPELVRAIENFVEKMDILAEYLPASERERRQIAEKLGKSKPKSWAGGDVSALMRAARTDIRKAHSVIDLANLLVYGLDRYELGNAEVIPFGDDLCALDLSNLSDFLPKWPAIKKGLLLTARQLRGTETEKPDKKTGRELVNNRGEVISNPSEFISAMDAITLFPKRFPNFSTLNRFLKKHGTAIRLAWPLTKKGTPNQRRKFIHLGDLKERVKQG